MTTEERLTKLETRVTHIDDTVKDIQNQVSNHIPTDIKELRRELYEFKLYQSKLFVGLLTAVILTLIGVICNIVL